VESDGGISVIVPGARNMLVGETVADVAGEELALESAARKSRYCCGGKSK
jgi:hypothetical protein